MFTHRLITFYVYTRLLINTLTRKHINILQSKRIYVFTHRLIAFYVYIRLLINILTR